MSSDRKPAGWYSRRHETREANNAAREAYQARADRRPRQHWDREERRWVKVPR